MRNSHTDQKKSNSLDPFTDIDEGSFTSIRTPEHQDCQESQDFQDFQDHQENQEKHESDYGSDAISSFIRSASNEDRMGSWVRDGFSPTWNFVRLLKGHPFFCNMTAEQAFEAIPWDETEFGEDDQLIILAEWDRVQFVAGVGPLEWADKMATQHPLEKAPGPKRQLYQRFVSIAAWLQVLRGDQPIFLPVARLAPILETSERTISALRALAKDNNLLIETAPGSWRGNKAAESRFNVSLFPQLAERQ